MESSKEDTKSLWKLLSPHKPKNKSFYLLLLLVILSTSFELILPLYSSYLVDSISNDGINFLVILGLIIIVLFSAIFEAILGWFGGRTGHQISFKLRFSLIGKLLHSQVKNLEQEHSAELSARIVNDSQEVKNVLAEDLIGLFSGLVSLLAVISIMFLLDWRLTLVLVSCVLFGFILITPIALMMNNIGKATQAAEANLMKYITEWLRYRNLIKSHNAESDLHNESKTLLQECFNQEMRATKILALIGPIANLVLMISMIAILAFSAYWIKEGSVTLGTVTAFLLYLFGLTFPLMSMAMFFSNLNKAIGAASRLTEISTLPAEQSSAKEFIKNVDKLEVSNLTFVRGEKHILNNISYRFSPSKLTIVIGESGSGKSTLLNQFLGFYPETHSSVLINDKCLTNFNLASVRQVIAWVDQEPQLLHASIRQNLTLGLREQIDNQEIFHILQSVGLEVWLNRINWDLDQIVSEQANQFSGGEKQRFAIARAILRKAKVLLLDEPTSALDNQNKNDLVALLRTLTKNMIVIMISHDHELVTSEDDVIQLQNGTICEQ